MELVTLGISVFLLLIAVLNMLVGLKRGWPRAILRLATLLIVFFASLILAKAFAGQLADMLAPVLEEAFANSPEIAELWRSNPSFAQGMGVVCRIILPPVFFFVLYVVLKALSWIVYAIIAAILLPKRHGLVRWAKSKPCYRLGGLLVGAVTAVLGMVVFLTPVLGYVDFAKEAVSQVDASMQGNVDEAGTLANINRDLLTPITEIKLAAPVFNAFGKPTFNTLTKTDWNGTEVTLSGEAQTMLRVAHGVSVITSAEDMQSYGTEQTDAIREVADGLGSSQLISTMLSELLNHASNAWLRGEKYLGIEMKTEDENVAIIMGGFLTMFSTSDKDNLHRDLTTFAEALACLVEHGALAAVGDPEASPEAFVQKLADDALLQDLLAVLRTDPRTQPVVAALSDVGSRMLVEQLGDPADYLANHGDLLDDLSISLKEAVGNDEVITTERMESAVNLIIEHYELPLPSSATTLIVLGLEQNFTAEEIRTMTTEEMTDRLIDYLANVEDFAELLAAQPIQ